MDKYLLEIEKERISYTWCKALLGSDILVTVRSASDNFPQKNARSLNNRHALFEDTIMRACAILGSEGRKSIEKKYSI